VIKRTATAARQIDELFEYYAKNGLVQAARNLIDIIEKVADDLEEDPTIGSRFPNITDLDYLWVRRDPYVFAYVQPDIGDMEPCTIVTNVLNQQWLTKEKVMPVDEIVPWD